MNKPTLRKAKLDDAQRIAEINRDSYVFAYKNDELGLTSEVLKNKKIVNEKRITSTEQKIENGDIFILELDDSIIGFIMPNTDENGRKRVGGIYLDPEYIGNGYGNILLEKSIQFYGKDEPIYAEVASFNEKVIKFYERHGFEVDEDQGEIKHWINDDLFIPVFGIWRNNP